MNIKKELAKAQNRKDLQNRFKRAFSVLRSFMCQHKNLASEVIRCSLGNCDNSIIEELLGEKESKKLHQVFIRRTYCVDCGREIYREFIDEQEVPNHQYLCQSNFIKAIEEPTTNKN